MLGLTVGSGGGWIITNVQQRLRDPQWRQFLQLLLVFWSAQPPPSARCRPLLPLLLLASTQCSLLQNLYWMAVVLLPAGLSSP
jgi:hypothetical protein